MATIPRDARVDFEGFLQKQSEWLKEWRKRYFRLVGNKLYFSKTAEAQPHGVIDLARCLTVKSAEDKLQGKQYAFEVAIAMPDGKTQSFFLIAGDAASKDAWIHAIGRAIVHSSKSYRADSSSDEDD